MKKKSFIMKKRNFFCAEILKGYCPVRIVREKEKKNCIAMQGSVLQEVSGLRGFYVAIQ